MSTLPTYTSLLALAWRQYRYRFDIILFANLLIALPVNVFIDFTTPQTTIQPGADIMMYVQTMVSDPSYQIHLLVQLLGNVVFIVITLAIILAMKYNYYRKPKTIPALLRQAVQLYPMALLASLGVAVAVVVGFIIFIIPGIVVSILLSFTLPALVWHRLSAAAALRYSWQVVWHEWWVVFSYSLTTEFMVSAIIILLIYFLPNTPGFTTVALTIASILQSFTVVFSVVLFNVCEKLQPTASPHS